MSSMSTAQSASASDSTFQKCIVLMGVSGCGKSSVGAELSLLTGLPYLEGDELHGPENVRKMRDGVPLTDADRWPWLDRCALALRDAPQGSILGCSALRRCYRDRLRKTSGIDDLRFVHLEGGMRLLQARMSNRSGHFMPLALLQSQLDTLEPPALDERALTLDIAQPVSRLARTILATLNADQREAN